MPELPEVETIARGLAKRVTGNVIESVWLGQKKEPLKSPAAEIASVLEQSRITEVRRMGKHIVFDLDRVEHARVEQARVARALLPAKSNHIEAASENLARYARWTAEGGRPHTNLL